MFRNRSVNVHAFSMVPRADIPRSSFRIQQTHKTTFDAGLLIPVYVDEVLPGDSFNLKMTAFARLSTPLFPIMDNMYLDSFFFFVPNRIVWDNWTRFMGERDPDPDSSIDYIVPWTTAPAGGYPINSLQDYMGLGTIGQVTAGAQHAHSALPLRAYNLIWNEWFRDENLQDSVAVPRGDGPDPSTDYNLVRRGKRHDYFTACLPWPQKGPSVALPLGTSAPVFFPTNASTWSDTQTGPAVNGQQLTKQTGQTAVHWGNTPAENSIKYLQIPSDAFADLSSATAATINQLRQSFQIQKLLERDARGGTRYTEIVRSHFGVISPDARLQRPEYLGGGSTPVNINPVAQTSATGAGDSTTPLGELGAMGTVVSRNNGFRQSFTEHGYIIGLVSVRADLTYQQGLRKMWTRASRYDFYFPVFSHLGEQAVLQREIYLTGIKATDDIVFGYQERWAEYRHHPSRISGLFRSTAAGTLDPWHLSQHFTAAPTLNAQFISDTPPVERIVAVGAEANGQQFIFDAFFDEIVARPMPMYSVPGLIDHF